MTDFIRYLEYDEYVELGGTLSEDTFAIYERKAQRWLDCFTFNRIPLLPEIPDVVKETLVEFISKLNEYSSQNNGANTISQYSNGVENITYRKSSEVEIKKSLKNLCKDWLPDYLVCRSVKFDVTDYIQPANNNI